MIDFLINPGGRRDKGKVGPEFRTIMIEKKFSRRQGR
jgi:hypothetical protein